MVKNMNTRTADEKKIGQAASDWLARRTNSERDEETEREFEIWRRADPRHDEAYTRVSRLFSVIGDIEDPELLKLADPNYLQAGMVKRFSNRVASIAATSLSQLRPQVFAVMAITLVVISIAVINNYMFESVQAYSTQTAEIQEVQLSDGSVVTLGARSNIEVAFNGDERHVTLVDGQAFFDVEKDADRPFIVRSNGTQIQVVGTRFNVHKGPAGLEVAVEEGVVEVSLRGYDPERGGDHDNSRGISSLGSDENSGLETEPTGSPTVAVLEAGEQITSTSEGVLSNIEVVDAALPPSSWRKGRLIYTDARFAELVADVNRYFDGHIQLASKEVADMRISGVFWTANIDELIYTLPENLPVELIDLGNNSIVVKLRRSE